MGTLQYTVPHFFYVAPLHTSLNLCGLFLPHTITSFPILAFTGDLVLRQCYCTLHCFLHWASCPSFYAFPLLFDCASCPFLRLISFLSFELLLWNWLVFHPLRHLELYPFISFFLSQHSLVSSSQMAGQGNSSYTLSHSIAGKGAASATVMYWSSLAAFLLCLEDNGSSVGWMLILLLSISQLLSSCTHCALVILAVSWLFPYPSGKADRHGTSCALRATYHSPPRLTPPILWK